MSLLESHRFKHAIFVFAASLCLLAVTTKAQMIPTPQPEKVSNRVLQLAAEGKVNEADQALREALSQCQQPTAPPNCSFLLTFTQAYLAQQKGSAGIQEARELYSRIIKSDPANGPALNNLALVEDSTGNASRAEELWATAIAKDPGRADHYALLLGDHFLRLKNIDGALKAYDVAERSSPTAAAPRRRIVSAYRQTQKNSDLDPLEARAREWELVDPSSARAAYEFLMSRYSSDGAYANEADRVLVQWSILLARNEWLDDDSLSHLPQEWNTPGIQELKEYIATPTQRPHWNWWQRSPDRDGATFEFARAMGRLQLRASSGGAQRAQACFQWALSSVTPGALTDSSPVSNGYLRVSQELASLYFDHPELDPDGKQVSEMMVHLYEGKMRAIELGRRPVSQAYHTTLAYIYVARGVWTSKPGTPSYMSALYQLQAVLDDATFREHSEGYFQPLPEIKGMLARAFVERGDKVGAAKLSLSAAIAYLDSDAIPESQRSLDQGVSFGSAGPEVSRLQRIIKARAESEKVTLDQMSSEKLPWLFQPSGILTEPFLKRQRFKIYADLLKAAENEPQRLTSALEAYRLVVEQQTNLVGAGDLLRWQSVESALLTSASGQPIRPRVVVLSDFSTVVGQRTKLPIALAGDDRPMAIAVQQETPTAVEVLRAVGVSRVHKIQPYIRLGLGQLFVTPAVGSIEADPLIQQLKSDPNLRAVIRSGVAPT